MKAQTREPALTIILTVISNQPPELEAAEQGHTERERQWKTGDNKARTKEKGRERSLAYESSIMFSSSKLPGK